MTPRTGRELGNKLIQVRDFLLSLRVLRFHTENRLGSASTIPSYPPVYMMIVS